MKKQFVVHLSFLLLINLLIKPLYLFGIDRSVQNLVGPSSYGWYWALFNFVYLFQVINDLGLQNFTTTFIGRQRQGVDKYFGYLGGVKLLSSLVFVVLVLVVSWWMDYLDWALLVPILVSQVCISLIFFLRGAIAGLGHYFWDSLISVLDKALMIVLCGYGLIWGSGFDIYDFAVYQSISLLATAIVALIFLVRAGIVWRPRWSKVLTWAMVKRSFPFALTFVLTTIFTRIDAVMLENLLSDGAYQVGIYAAGYRLLDASNMLAYLFIGLLLPMFSNAYKDTVASRELLKTAIMMMLVLVLSISLPTVYFSSEIMELLYDQNGPQWQGVLNWLMLAFIAMGMSYIAGAFLLAHEEVGRLNWIYVFGVVINVIGNAILIPEDGVLGAAQMTVLTQFVVSLFAFGFIWKKMGSLLDVRGWLSVITYVFGALLMLFVWESVSEAMTWWLGYVLLGAFFVVYGVVLKMLPYDLLLDKVKR